MECMQRKGYVLVNLYMDQLDQLTAEVNEKLGEFGQCIFCKRQISDCDCNEPEFETLGQKLSKETREDIHFLHLLHREKFGNNDDYFGTCLISTKHWEQ